jgi:hypothetical protein
MRHADDTLVVWPHGREQLQNFLSHLNSLRPSIQFTMEMESGRVIAFLDVLVIRKWTTLATKVSRKPAHTGQQLNFKTNQPLHVKRRLIQSLHNRASIIHQKQHLFNKLSNLRHDLQVNGYPQGFNDSVINSKGTGMVQIKRKSLWALCISHM